MLDDPRQHAAYQATVPIKALSDVPDLNGERHFMETELPNTKRLARNRLSEHHRKIGKFSDALNTLHDERDSSSPRAAACPIRVTQKNRSQRQ